MKELVGRICVKLAGRDARGKCVIIGVVDKNTVMVTGPKKLTGVRRRKVNISHLALTPHKIDIREEAGDEEVLEAIKKAGLEEYMARKAEVAWTP